MDDKCILDPQRDCLGLQKANMLEKQMDQWREQSRGTHKELFDRMGKLERTTFSKYTLCRLYALGPSVSGPFLRL